MISPGFFSDSAGQIASNSIAPALTAISLIAAILCTLFLIIGAYQYITSSGNPSNLIRAKVIIRNALIGLVIVLSAAAFSALLRHAYGPVAQSTSAASVPNLSAIKPTSASSGLVTIIIKVISGVLGAVIETVAIPFLKALSYFTSGTPLIAANHSVFSLWVSTVGIADALMVLVIMLLGLHVMSYASLGLYQISLKQLLPQIGLTFLLINSSVFIIDAVISLSNVLIKAISNNQAANNVWKVLSDVVKQPSAYGLAALIIMTIFLVFSVILLIYYVGRIVTIYLGAIIAPLAILCWLIPATRDMAVVAVKRYFSAVFVLFIHVIILELAATLLAGMSEGGANPDPLMAMVVGLATLVALLKTQGVMNQLSYATIGPKMARKVAQQLVLNVSYMGSQASQAMGNLIPVGRLSAGYQSYSNRQNRISESNKPNSDSPKPPSMNKDKRP